MGPARRSMRRTARRTSRRTSRRVNRRQQAMSANAAPPPPPAEPQVAAPPPAAEPDMFEALEKLGRLHADGILTDEEFAAEKAKLLGG